MCGCCMHCSAVASDTSLLTVGLSGGAEHSQGVHGRTGQGLCSQHNCTVLCHTF